MQDNDGDWISASGVYLEPADSVPGHTTTTPRKSPLGQLAFEVRQTSPMTAPIYSDVIASLLSAAPQGGRTIIDPGARSPGALRGRPREQRALRTLPLDIAMNIFARCVKRGKMPHVKLDA